MEGMVFDIKHFAVHDGPGIRSTVFFKGCPLNCAWCHNPEGISSKPFIYERQEKLGNKTFYTQEKIGTFTDVAQIIEELKSNQLFYEESGGGVTFSGGEPMQQIDFLEELLIHSKIHGWHTTIDTSGYAKWDHFLRVLPLCDLFLFDLKHVDEVTHKEKTDCSNSLILNNLRALCAEGASVRLRIPVVPGFNDTVNDMKAIGSFISQLNNCLVGVDLLPFHSIAKQKYKQFRISNAYENVRSLEQLELEPYKKILEDFGVDVSLGA